MARMMVGVRWVSLSGISETAYLTVVSRVYTAWCEQEKKKKTSPDVLLIREIRVECDMS